MLSRILRPSQDTDGRPRRLPWFVDLFALITVVSAAAVGLMATDYFTRLTMLVAVVGCVVFWRFLRDPIVVVAATYMAFGAVLGWGFDFYDHIWWYDKFAHFSFSIVGTMGLARLYLHRFRVDSALLILIALWMAWQGVGAMWEIGEWLADRIEGTRHSRGYFDTLYDMIWNGVGAAVGAWMYWGWFRTDADREIIQSTTRSDQGKLRP